MAAGHRASRTLRGRRGPGMPGLVVLLLASVTAACGRPDPPVPTGHAIRAEPGAGAWRTWVLDSPTEIPVPPPPEPGSAEARVEELELEAHLDRRSPRVQDDIATWDGLGEPISAPWFRMAFDLVSARPDDLPASSRAYALLAVAGYDAMVAAWHYKYRYNRRAPDLPRTLRPLPPDPSYPSEHAAVAGAASRVLAYLFPEHPAADLDRIASRASESRLSAGANWPSDVEAGLDLGRQVAGRVISRARQDGSGAPCTKEAPGGAPRYWAPPPGTAAPPVQPCAGEWRTWVLNSGGQLRPEPPAAFGSEEFVDQSREVVEEKNNLTGGKRRAVDYWTAGAGTPRPAGLWNEVAMAYLRKRTTTEPQAERALVLVNVAMADAAVAAWDAKFTYWDPRPENGVRDAGVDSEWKPYVATPLSPSYVSVHGAYAGAGAEVLSWMFPEGDGAFRAKAQEAADTQVWGGADWGLSRSIGLEVGTGVGKLVIERARADGPPPAVGRRS